MKGSFDQLLGAQTQASTVRRAVSEAESNLTTSADVAHKVGNSDSGLQATGQRVRCMEHRGGCRERTTRRALIKDAKPGATIRSSQPTPTLIYPRTELCPRNSPPSSCSYMMPQVTHVQSNIVPTEQRHTLHNIHHVAEGTASSKKAPSLPGCRFRHRMQPSIWESTPVQATTMGPAGYASRVWEAMYHDIGAMWV